MEVDLLLQCNKMQFCYISENRHKYRHSGGEDNVKGAAGKTGSSFYATKVYNYLGCDVFILPEEVVPMNEVEPIKDKRQLEKMKKYMHENNLRNYAFFVLGINSGLRISDLLQLKVSDVFDDNKRIKDRIKLKEQKTGKTKTFPISDTAKKALQEYAGCTILQPEDILFQSRKGGALTRVQAYRIIQDAALVAGVKAPVGTHTLRKTFGYNAYKQCGDISLVMKVLNHSSQADTLRYIGITQEECDNIYLNLNL